MSSLPVHSALFTVSTPAELDAAVNAANATPGPDTIRFAADITVTPVAGSGMPDVTTSLTIDGAGHKLSRSGGVSFSNVVQVSPSGSLRLVNLTVEGFGYLPTLVGAGGAGLVFGQGPIEIIGCRFIANRHGGAPIVRSLVPARIIASLFQSNEGDPLNGATVGLVAGGEIVNSIFDNNRSFMFSPTDGATVAYLYGSPAIVRQSTFSNNVVGSNPLLLGTMQVSGSAFFVNSASAGNTGSLIMADGAAVAVTDSTFGGNSVGSVFRSLDASIPIAATNVTVVGNKVVGTAPPAASGPLSITNSLLATNTAGNCTFVPTQSNNASNDATCPGAVSIVAGVDFVPPTFNGGPTQTYALPPGSAAINASGAGATVADQRGATRVGARDIGAFEFASTPAYPTVQFASAGATVVEGGTLSIPLSVTGAANFTGIAHVYVIDTESGTASLGADYVDGALRVIVIDCSSGTCPSSLSFNLATSADAVFENDETVSFQIVATDGLAVLGAQAGFTATIVNSATVTVSASDPSATENPPDNGRFTVDLGQPNATGAPIVVSYGVTGTAAAGTDFAALSGTVAIPPSQQTADIVVVPIDDALQEPAKTVVITLTGTSHPSAGVSATLATVTIVDGLENPGAPVIGSAIAGDGTATIAFAPPASDGGSAITAYVATCLPGGATGSGAASPVVVSGLTNGTAYSCSVVASNAVGPSAPSGNVAVTPLSVPGAPAITTATPGNAQAVITFTPPAITGGSPITGYTASCAPGPFTATGAASPLTVSGLANGTTYTCIVTATTVAGPGPASPPATVTPRTLPGAPTAVSASPGNGSATITFGPPVSDGGAAISSYTATCNPGALTTSGAASPLTVAGMANGTAYSCAVTAANVAGTGPAATAASVTPGTRSYSGPSATGSGTITASFTGGGATCFFANPQFIPLTGHAASPPTGSAPGVSFPHGLFDFRTTGCTPGSTITMTITYPAVLAAAQYWKYGPEPGAVAPHWYVMPATVAGSTITFSITDGQQGDDDLTANGAIADQGGPGAPTGGGAIQTPTLSEWALLVLALLVLAIARRSMPRASGRRPA